jgi:hypothetical protein
MFGQPFLLFIPGNRRARSKSERTNLRIIKYYSPNGIKDIAS